MNNWCGLDFLFQKFPKLKYGGCPWDGYWRVVVYDIAEEELKDFLKKESLWGKILVFKAILSPEENRRFALLFTQELGKTGAEIQAHPTTEQLVSRLLTCPPLPKGL